MSPDSLSILLVDDVPENLVALEALLRREDLTILKARSGSEALEVLLTHDVSLALLDVQMPEMDGFELAELMRGSERTKRVPIIFVTAGGHDPARVFRGYDSGAVDFLHKPLDAHVLTSKVDVFLELARHRKQLAGALQLNEVFVGILGHDLRNPLSSFKVGLEFLDGELTDERQRRVLKRMRSSSQRMQVMIEELLDLTRVRLAGGAGLVRAHRPLELGGLLERTVEELRAVHEDREVTLDAPASCVTIGDEERLNQLFSNLVANALLHGTPGTGVRVRLTARAPDAVVEVENHGTIPREVLASIFEPFRGRQKGATAAKGLGLGRFIAEQIAQAPGGRIDVASSESDGTTFTVRLPLAS
jgi:signal transduction histidine kinase